MLGRQMSKTLPRAVFWTARTATVRPNMGRRLTLKPDWSPGEKRSCSSRLQAASQETPRSVTRSVRSVCRPEWWSVHTTCTRLPTLSCNASRIKGAITARGLTLQQVGCRCERHHIAWANMASHVMFLLFLVNRSRG